MKINIGNEESGDEIVEIKWEHRNFKEPTHLVGVKHPIMAQTLCWLKVSYANGNMVEERGMALCKWPDVFSKEKGRRKSLARALAHVKIIWKEEREQIWVEYFKNRKP